MPGPLYKPGTDMAYKVYRHKMNKRAKRDLNSSVRNAPDSYWDGGVHPFGIGSKPRKEVRDLISRKGYNRWKAGGKSINNFYSGWLNKILNKERVSKSVLEKALKKKAGI